MEKNIFTNMKKSIMTIMLATMFAASGCANAQGNRESSQSGNASAGDSLPKVYFFKEITPENLV